MLKIVYYSSSRYYSEDDTLVLLLLNDLEHFKSYVKESYLSGEIPLKNPNEKILESYAADFRDEENFTIILLSFSGTSHFEEDFLDTYDLSEICAIDMLFTKKERASIIKINNRKLKEEEEERKYLEKKKKYDNFKKLEKKFKKGAPKKPKAMSAQALIEKKREEKETEKYIKAMKSYKEYTSLLKTWKGDNVPKKPASMIKKEKERKKQTDLLEDMLETYARNKAKEELNNYSKKIIKRLAEQQELKDKLGG